MSSLLMTVVVLVVAFSFIDILSKPYEKTSENTESTLPVISYDTEDFVSSTDYYYYLRIMSGSDTL